MSNLAEVMPAMPTQAPITTALSNNGVFQVTNFNEAINAASFLSGSSLVPTDYRRWVPVKNLSSDSEQISEEIKRLQAKKKAIDNRTEWLKSNIKFAMQTLGIEKVKHPVLPISLRSSPQFSVNVENAENLPSEYQVVKIEPNKKALLDLFKDNPSFALNGVTFTKGQFLKIG